jgi:thiosulfate/3-mercaptopyruvate sulfurtransferase
MQHNHLFQGNNMSSLILPAALVSVDWLHQHLNHSDLLVLDGSFFMPDVERDGRLEWFDERIPGALFFDFDREICDRSSDLPHMMPSVEDFQKSVQNLGINQDSTIVVYDSLGIFSSPRVWWMLKAMGAANIAVLDGGLPAWKEQALPLQSGEQLEAIKKGNFIANYQPQLFCNAADVLSATQDKQRIIIDARSRERFLAEVPEPREGLRCGHMPNARNLPFADVLSEQSMQDAYQLALLFEAIAPRENGLIFSCGSGVTACILALGATLAGYENISVYDGSWSEWGSSAELPVVN